jgi:hypothetical protein
MMGETSKNLRVQTRTKTWVPNPLAKPMIESRLVSVMKDSSHHPRHGSVGNDPHNTIDPAVSYCPHSRSGRRRRRPHQASSNPIILQRITNTSTKNKASWNYHARPTGVVWRLRICYGTFIPTRAITRTGSVDSTSFVVTFHPMYVTIVLVLVFVFCMPVT